MMKHIVLVLAVSCLAALVSSAQTPTACQQNAACKCTADIDSVDNTGNCTSPCWDSINVFFDVTAANNGCCLDTQIPACQTRMCDAVASVVVRADESCCYGVWGEDDYPCEQGDVRQECGNDSYLFHQDQDCGEGQPDGEGTPGPGADWFYVFCPEVDLQTCPPSSGMKSKSMQLVAMCHEGACDD